MEKYVNKKRQSKCESSEQKYFVINLKIFYLYITKYTFNA